MPLTVEWLRDFALTLVVEIPVYTVALRGRLGWRRALLVALGVNAATHPIAWHLIVRAQRPWPDAFAAVEIGVWLVEAALVFAFARRRGLPLSEAVVTAFVANALSAGLGLMLAAAR